MLQFNEMEKDICTFGDSCETTAVFSSFVLSWLCHEVFEISR